PYLSLLSGEELCPVFGPAGAAGVGWTPRRVFRSGREPPDGGGGWKHRFDVPFRIPASQERTPRVAAKTPGWLRIRFVGAQIRPVRQSLTPEGQAKSLLSRRHGRPSLRVPCSAPVL